MPGEIRQKLTLSIGSEGAAAIRELAELKDESQGEVVSRIVIRELRRELKRMGIRTVKA